MRTFASGRSNDVSPTCKTMRPCIRTVQAVPEEQKLLWVSRFQLKFEGTPTTRFSLHQGTWDVGGHQNRSGSPWRAVPRVRQDPAVSTTPGGGAQQGPL